MDYLRLKPRFYRRKPDNTLWSCNNLGLNTWSPSLANKCLVHASTTIWWMIRSARENNCQPIPLEQMLEPCTTSWNRWGCSAPNLSGQGRRRVYQLTKRSGFLLNNYPSQESLTIDTGRWPWVLSASPNLTHLRKHLSIRWEVLCVQR